jgi:aspartate aminotransferase
MNERVQSMKKAGKDVVNLTAGQLPFRPEAHFIQSISTQLNFLSSFQYPPVSGLADLQAKIVNDWSQERFNPQPLSDVENRYALIGHGSKQCLFNFFGTVLNPHDEVIIFSPYWVSFPEMIRFWGAKAVVVEHQSYDGLLPDLEGLERAITGNTKAIVINSPNNPSGLSYPKSWCMEFSKLVMKYPQILLVSDEIYDQLYYYDPAPTFFYQVEPALLPRTIVINGISKSLSSTGLRLGWAHGDKTIIEGMSKIQGHSTSGVSTLVQNALLDYDMRLSRSYLKEIRLQLRKSSEILRDIFREFGLAVVWYQTSSAFYFLLDFSKTPYFQSKYSDNTTDYSQECCEDILLKTNVAILPASYFGLKNYARVSFTTNHEQFKSAITHLAKILTKEAT